MLEFEVMGRVIQYKWDFGWVKRWLHYSLSGARLLGWSPGSISLLPSVAQLCITEASPPPSLWPIFTFQNIDMVTGRNGRVNVCEVFARHVKACWYSYFIPLSVRPTLTTSPASLTRKLSIITEIHTFPYRLHFVKQNKSSMRIWF